MIAIDHCDRCDRAEILAVYLSATCFVTVAEELF